ncbi:hypothetical protein Esi_0045_0022 [Ectocarpus siliculosus]|uniref:Uncharacterized protein n=1 Tax=Ectocarpus siliculosus TaxID=2880 RepID=D7G1F9_ECTSI|nr:hypothetical protein Esi_0045_0022 [Ectocarpus siliculosus]|eukprot:CBJ26767.1 hypothetical protein Esi_0045_0022 [Ectocarpus siliculosus]
MDSWVRPIRSFLLPTSRRGGRTRRSGRLHAAREARLRVGPRYPGRNLHSAPNLPDVQALCGPQQAYRAGVNEATSPSAGIQTESARLGQARFGNAGAPWRARV